MLFTQLATQKLILARIEFAHSQIMLIADRRGRKVFKLEEKEEDEEDSRPRNSQLCSWRIKKKKKDTIINFESFYDFFDHE